MAAFARRVVRLPDHPRMLRELRLLERSTNAGGKDAVNHARGGHDDFSNVACGVLRVLDARHAAESEVPVVMPYIASGGPRFSDSTLRPSEVAMPVTASPPPAAGRPETDVEKMNRVNAKRPSLSYMRGDRPLGSIW
jgi:hypothetical protein